MDCTICPICLEMYGQKGGDEKCPRILFCGHTICAKCLQDFSNRREENYIVCPICRQKGSENKDINSLPVNRMVFDLIHNKKLSDSMQIRNLDSLRNSHSSQENLEDSLVEGVKEIFEVNNDAITFKIISLGYAGAGKTSLIQRYTTKEFSEEYIVTIGLDFSYKYLNIYNQPIKLTLYDTAGTEAFQGITASYIRGTHGCIFVFDLTEEKSFETVETWLQFLKDFNDDKKIAKILIGNKLDLETERKVDRKQAEKFASENGMKYIEASAKTGKNVDKAFNLLARTIMDNYKRKKDKKGRKNSKKGINKNDLKHNKGIHLDKNKNSDKNKDDHCC